MQNLNWLRAVACCSMLLASGCATRPTVRVDMDPTTNVRSYKTFAFLEPVATDGVKSTALVSSSLKQATRTQLERLGYAYAESEPDLRVNFFLKIEDKQEVVSGGSGYYGYRQDYYGTWAGYPYVDALQYKAGTLSVDLVDATKKQLVWQGVAEGVVREKALKDPAPAIEQVVAKVFSNFPNAP